MIVRVESEPLLIEIGRFRFRQDILSPPLDGAFKNYMNVKL